MYTNRVLNNILTKTKKDMWSLNKTKQPHTEDYAIATETFGQVSISYGWTKPKAQEQIKSYRQAKVWAKLLDKKHVKLLEETRPARITKELINKITRR